jgi:hypothetical protein
VETCCIIAEPAPVTRLLLSHLRIQICDLLDVLEQELIALISFGTMYPGDSTLIDGADECSVSAHITREFTYDAGAQEPKRLHGTEMVMGISQCIPVEFFST